VKALLQLADIPRSTYYYWVNTFGMPDKDSELKDVIQAIYEEHGCLPQRKTGALSARSSGHQPLPTAR
jgi:hypothetical protein